MNRRDFLGLAAGAGMLTFHTPQLFGDAMSDQRPTGFVFDPVYLDHLIATDHPESPRRLQSIMHRLNSTDWFSRLVRIPGTVDALSWVGEIHTPEHIESIKTHYARTHDVVLAMVSGILSAVKHVCSGDIRNAFCATRPPGHHAMNTGQEEGFCFYNGIAIAARYAQKHYKLKNILIVDWDYHHGNGTEAAFYSDPSVLFFSTHDLYAYPGTGHPERRGEGAGLGYNINVHLGCGTTDVDILAAFENSLLPAVRNFRPDLILISAGFDSRQNDLLGCYDVTDAGFVKLTEMMMALADEYCNGRIVSVLEGGYNIEGNASAVMHHVRTLANL